MVKNDILSLVEDLSAQQLFEFIAKGVCTFEELRETGELDASKRKQIAELLKGNERKEDEAWEKARYGNELSIADYITQFPGGKYVAEAKNRIDSLKHEREKVVAQKRGVLDQIKRNPNSFRSYEIKSFLSNGTFSQDDLTNYCGIPQSAIENLDKINRIELDINKIPEPVQEGHTEVYFWGVPGSGKSCALGAILHMAEKRGCLNITPGNGYKYANQLKNIFTDDDVADDFLPLTTALDYTQNLPLTLTGHGEKNGRLVSLIELSGEIFKCFYAVNANATMPSEVHEMAFNSMKTFLDSNNRKIHFFFIDYDIANRADAEGVRQSDYLAAAATYFKTSSIFSKSTDAIYVVLTKSDLLLNEDGDPVEEYDERVTYAKKHLEGQNYSSFIEELKRSCKTYSINQGKLQVVPFSLGKVYFREICNFEGSSASQIVNILMQRIPVQKKGFLNIFNR